MQDFLVSNQPWSFKSVAIRTRNISSTKPYLCKVRGQRRFLRLSYADQHFSTEERKDNLFAKRRRRPCSPTKLLQTRVRVQGDWPVLSKPPRVMAHLAWSLFASGFVRPSSDCLGELCTPTTRASNQQRRWITPCWTVCSVEVLVVRGWKSSLCSSSELSLVTDGNHQELFQKESRR